MLLFGQQRVSVLRRMASRALHRCHRGPVIYEVDRDQATMRYLKHIPSDMHIYERLSAAIDKTVQLTA